MKNRMTYRLSLCTLGAVAVLCILFSMCKREITPTVFYKEEDLLISAYLEKHSDEFSTLVEVLQITGIEPVLNAYGHYTFFAPDNKAFEDFCKENGHTSVKEFDIQFLADLVKYHLLGRDIETNFLPNGVLNDTTYSGDNLVFSYSTEGNSSIIVNGEASITERDIKVTNGHINKIDKVLKPVFSSIYDLLAENPGYSIFSQALKATGLKDTLSRIYIQLSENKYIRDRFTLFVESDVVFNNAGISSFDDLKAKYSTSGDITNPLDGLHIFMAYHCLAGTYYLNQLDSFNYPTLAQNKLVHLTISDNIYLNQHLVGNNGDTTDFQITVIRETSNKSARNGVYHMIDKVLEVYEPGPTYFLFDLTSYQGIDLGNIYTAKDLQYIKGIFIENTGLYYRMSALDEDSSYLETTSQNLGWIVEFDIPPIIKGRYKVDFHWVSTGDRTSAVQAFWDNEILGQEFSIRQQKRPPVSPPEWLYDFHYNQVIGTVILDETKPHKLKFFGLADGYGDFDYVRFLPY